MAWNVLTTARQFDLTPGPRQYLLDHGCDVIAARFGPKQSDTSVTGDALVEQLDGINAVIGAPRLSADVLDRVPALMHVSRRGVGYDSIDMDAATRAGVVVTITPGTIEDAVADHALALLLAVAKQIVTADRALRQGDWSARLGTDLWQKTIGIIGLGRIGQKVARRARGFDMRVLAYDPFLAEAGHQVPDVTFCSLGDLLAQADFVSVNANLNDSSRHLLGRHEFASMKSTAIVVNTARGPVVDEQALADALCAGTIAGAGIDTFERESHQDTVLTTAPNAILTPHTAGYSREGHERANMLAARNVVGVALGHLDNETVLVNPDAWQRRVAGTGRFASVPGLG